MQSRYSKSFLRYRRAFSLVESVLALAIFAFAAIMISQVCFNCLFPLDMQQKNSEEDTSMDIALQAILQVADYDSLDDGVEIKLLNSTTARVYGYAEPTEIIDLFQLEVVVDGDGKKLSKKLLVIRPDWYENSNDRDTLLKDRTDYLDDFRRSSYDSDKKSEDEFEGDVKGEILK